MTSSSRSSSSSWLTNEQMPLESFGVSVSMKNRTTSNRRTKENNTSAVTAAIPARKRRRDEDSDRVLRPSKNPRNDPVQSKKVNRLVASKKRIDNQKKETNRTTLGDITVSRRIAPRTRASQALSKKTDTSSGRIVGSRRAASAISDDESPVIVIDSSPPGPSITRSGRSPVPPSIASVDPTPKRWPNRLTKASFALPTPPPTNPSSSRMKRVPQYVAEKLTANEDWGAIEMVEDSQPSSYPDDSFEVPAKDAGASLVPISISNYAYPTPVTGRAQRTVIKTHELGFNTKPLFTPITTISNTEFDDYLYARKRTTTEGTSSGVATKETDDDGARNADASVQSEIPSSQSQYLIPYLPSPPRPRKKDDASRTNNLTLDFLNKTRVRDSEDVIPTSQSDEAEVWPELLERGAVPSVSQGDGEGVGHQTFDVPVIPPSSVSLSLATTPAKRRPSAIGLLLESQVTSDPYTSPIGVSQLSIASASQSSSSSVPTQVRAFLTMFDSEPSSDIQAVPSRKSPELPANTPTKPPRKAVNVFLESQFGSDPYTSPIRISQLPLVSSEDSQFESQCSTSTIPTQVREFFTMFDHEPERSYDPLIEGAHSSIRTPTNRPKPKVPRTGRMSSRDKQEARTTYTTLRIKDGVKVRSSSPVVPESDDDGFAVPYPPTRAGKSPIISALERLRGRTLQNASQSSVTQADSDEEGIFAIPFPPMYTSPVSAFHRLRATAPPLTTSQSSATQPDSDDDGGPVRFTPKALRQWHPPSARECGFAGVTQDSITQADSDDGHITTLSPCAWREAIKLSMRPLESDLMRDDVGGDSGEDVTLTSRNVGASKRAFASPPRSMTPLGSSQSSVTVPDSDEEHEDLLVGDQ